MARLAAYYQEDFHHPSISYGPKRRKAAYVLYQEPRHNVTPSVFDRERIRTLGTSDPTLALHPSYFPTIEDMTLKQRSLMYGDQFSNNSQPPIQHFENFYNGPDYDHQYSRHPNAYENESAYSLNHRNTYDDERISRHRTGSKDRSRKRFSYAEPQNSQFIFSDMHMAPNTDKYGRQTPLPDLEYTECDNRTYQANLSPQMYYYNNPSQGRWQQLPWTAANSFVNPSLLSPPSPLDSGLSSQSITSSPSIDLEPHLVNQDHHSVSRLERQPICNCRQPVFYNTTHHLPGLRRHDSDRSNDTQYSNSYRLSRNESVNGHVIANNELDTSFPYSSHVRYGKLGLVGEPTDTDALTHAPQKCHGRRQQENMLADQGYVVQYEYVDENGVPLKKSVSRSRKSNKGGQKYIRPFVVITKASEIAAGVENRPSSKDEKGVKGREPESPMSVTASNSTSNSSSIASSSNELDSDDCRRSNKATEQEIRELEDMYNRCNLNDRDLLDRAERRDLPTAHQDPGKGGLKRSKSDTVYEMSSPLFHNPYDMRQRAPPCRRSGLPDRIADDMALRKLRKSSRRPSSTTIDNTITYMLCSSHFTPTVPTRHNILQSDNPDVELDDLSYRRHYFRKKSEIPDPQPPFGIPLRPPPARKMYSDYLHAVPSGAPQPLCHPRGNPDVVRDDMAFRTLRKDEPDRLYYDISQVYTKRRR